MPTFDMSEALKESYAVARTTAIEYYTLTFWMENWEEPARLNVGYDQFDAMIEAGAEEGGGGEMKTFYPVPMEFSLPSLDPETMPTFQFKFYDPERIVLVKLLEGQNSPAKILMFMRVYLSNRLHLGPETIPVPRYNVSNIKVSAASSTITGTCTFNDHLGRAVPFRTYTYAEYPGLRRG